MAAAQPAKGFVNFFKRAWDSYPEIVGSGFMGLIGIGLCITSCYLYEVRDGDNKVFKDRYTVYRPDDPRVKTIKPLKDP